MSALLARQGSSVVFDRDVRVTVDGFAVETLRIGFTIEKDLRPKPNSAEIIIYNLSRSSRERLHRHSAGKKKIPVVVEAGYRNTGRVLLFAGHMREAFSKAETDGTWATTLRAGDGDVNLRKTRKATSLRPGVSVERVIGDQFKALSVGLGNAYTEFKNQLKAGANIDADRLGKALSSGMNGSGGAAGIAAQMADSAGLEYSVQDGQVQVLKKGDVLAMRALVLSPQTGLEGSPSVDADGTMHLRARLVPGLSPGYPIQVTTYSRADLQTFAQTGVYPGGLSKADRGELDTVYRIEKVRFVGDSWGPDWNAEIDARDVNLGPKKKKKVTRS